MMFYYVTCKHLKRKRSRVSITHYEVAETYLVGDPVVDEPFLSQAMATARAKGLEGSKKQCPELESL